MKPMLQSLKLVHWLVIFVLFRYAAGGILSFYVQGDPVVAPGV